MCWTAFNYFRLLYYAQSYPKVVELHSTLITFHFQGISIESIEYYPDYGRLIEIQLCLTIEFQSFDCIQFGSIGLIVDSIRLKSSGQTNQNQIEHNRMIEIRFLKTVKSQSNSEIEDIKWQSNQSNITLEFLFI